MILGKGESVESSMNYLCCIVKMLFDYHNNIEKSVLTSTFYNLFFAAKEAQSKVLSMRNELNYHLYDNYKLNYEYWKRKISNCITGLEDTFDIDNLYDKSHSPEKRKYISSKDLLQEKEEQIYDFSHCGLLDVKWIGGELWENQAELLYFAKDALIRIKTYLSDIDNDVKVIESSIEGFYEKYEGDTEYIWSEELSGFPILYERFDFMRNEYLNTKWEEDKKDFKKKIGLYLTNSNHGVEDYKTYAVKMEIEATSLQKVCFDDPIKLPIEIYRNRFIYGESDINELFAFMYSHKLLTARIDAFKYDCPPDIKYKSIFKSIGHQIFAQKIIKIILRTINFENKYDYSALFMAFKDFDICCDITKRTQMATFVNDNIIYVEKQITPDSFKKITSLCTKSFGKLTEETLANTSLSEQDYDNLKPVYWGCVTILNFVFERNLGAERFASYLDNIHEESWGRITESDKKQLNELKALKSVIAGEAADF